MLKLVWIIARKEVLEAVRDVRSLLSTISYALLGPGVVGAVAAAQGPDPKSREVLIGMMSVFTLVAAFVGGMAIAMDIVAGERERRSLAALLAAPAERSTIAAGKWLAVALFAVGGLVLNLAGFAAIAGPIRPWTGAASLALGLLPLALLAASAQLWLSAACRTVKEAQNYLSMVVFLPMLAGLGLVFFPAARGWGSAWIPVIGQQLLIARVLRGDGAFFQALGVGAMTACAAALILAAAANRLGRDEIIDGD